MASILDKLTNPEAMKFIDQVGDPFKTLPHLPKNITEIFVQLSPWLAILGAIFGLIGGPLVALFGTLGSVVALNPLLMIATIVSAIVIIANSILLFMAFKPLQNRETKGWIYLFWSQMLSIVNMVFSLVGGQYTSIITTIISVLIGLYVLFEMRPFFGMVQAAVKKTEEIAAK